MMGLELNNLPVVDWELNLKLAGNNKNLAKDMLSMLTQSLPEEIHVINQHLTNHNHTALWNSIHKLHGAVAYCGLPRLKAVLHSLEIELKKSNVDKIPALIQQLNDEIELTLKQIVTG